MERLTAPVEIIDISKHNGTVDFAKVKAAGIKGVMVRVGWAGYDGKIVDNKGLDVLFHQNMKGAIAAGLDVGIYVYTYTKTPEAARVAAKECCQLVKDYKVTLPIAFDVEETTNTCLTIQGKEGLTNTVIAFLSQIKAEGYYPVWYSYTAFIMAHLNGARLKGYDLWVADYRNDEKLMQQQCGRSDYGMWQYIGDEGTCPGVSTACDRNYCYFEYPSEIAKLGLNGLAIKDTASQMIDYKTLYEEVNKKLKQIEAILNIRT